MIYDICIIGGGPTGIALLNEYLKLKKKRNSNRKK